MAFKLAILTGVILIGGCAVRSPLSLNFLPQPSETTKTPTPAEAQARFGTLSTDGSQQRQRALGEIERSR
jgi:hypothetical protein